MIWSLQLPRKSARQAAICAFVDVFFEFMDLTHDPETWAKNHKNLDIYFFCIFALN